MSSSASSTSLWENNLSFSLSIPVPLAVGSLVVIAAVAALNNSYQKKIEPVKEEATKKLANNDSELLQAQPLSRVTSYRIEEENRKRESSEFTRRGQLWSRHASWHLPKAPRKVNTFSEVYNNGIGIEHVLSILKKYEVDPVMGFLPSQDPLQRLSYARYHIWEDLADDLPKLLGASLGQAREPLRQLPVISTDKLVTDAELRRAHLLLCLFAHAYVWGGNTPLDTIPEGIARPLCEVSEKLGIPPVLGHPSIILYNWRRLDINGDICMENLSTLNNFFDGRDESWFYLITVDVEAKGASSIVPTLLAFDAIERYNEEKKIREVENKPSSPKSGTALKYVTLSKRKADDEYDSSAEEEIIYINEALSGALNSQRVTVYVTAQLKTMAVSIDAMAKSLATMREGCHPFIFYHRVRPFLSGWKHNPTVPNGVLYDGVSTIRQKYYGGSAAQSALLPFLDITLGIEHESNKSRDFLLAMRDYMLKPHRDFIQYIESNSCLRTFILDRMDVLAKLQAIPEIKRTSEEKTHLNLLNDLVSAYDLAVQNLKVFRDGHINLVAEYIMAQQKNKVIKGLEGTAGGKGTGGTDLMNFLKPIRDDCAEKIIRPSSHPTPSATNTDSSAQNLAEHPSFTQKVDQTSDFYFKDNGNIEDIDLFRGAATTEMQAYK